MIRNIPFAYTNDEGFTSDETKPSDSTKITLQVNPEAEKVVKRSIAVVIMIGIFILLWVVFGIAAFIMSIVCFGYSGSTGQHVIGLLLAIFFGPFYWIYFLVVKSYCGKPTSMYGGRRSSCKRR